MASEFELIRRYTGAFSAEECDEYINYIDLFDKNSELTHDKRTSSYVDHKSVNCCFHYDLPAYSYLSEEIIPRFKPCVEEYLETFTILNGQQFLVYDLKVKKIPIGGGFHAWHHENGSVTYCQRQFVIQLYLNDDFEGGETEFLYQNRRERPIKGDVLIFPAGFTHTHRGNPPIGGDKYLITSWGVVQNHG